MEIANVNCKCLLLNFLIFAVCAMDGYRYFLDSLKLEFVLNSEIHLSAASSDIELCYYI